MSLSDSSSASTAAFCALPYDCCGASCWNKAVTSAKHSTLHGIHTQNTDNNLKLFCYCITLQSRATEAFEGDSAFENSALVLNCAVCMQLQLLP